MNTDPLVSIILPVLNAEKYLSNAIESVLWQTYQNWELIAIDDGSQDSSHRILKKYASLDKRIKMFKNKKNNGIGFCMNLGLLKAKGEYIARQDADDISLPVRLEKQVNFFLENPFIGILGSFMVELNDNKLSSKRIMPTTHTEIKNTMFIRQAIQNPTMMIKVSNIPKNKFWYDGSLSPVDELDFFFRILHNVRFANIAEYLVLYRKHQHNSSLMNIKKTFGLTFYTRLKACLSYKYRPTLKSFLIHWLQSLVVFSFPNTFLYKVFQIWKDHNIAEIDLDNILFNPVQLENQIELLKVFEGKNRSFLIYKYLPAIR